MLSLHQLLSVSALRAGVCEGVARDQMAASQLSLRGKRNEAAEGEPAAEAYYFGVEAAETLTNPDRGRSPTQSCMHASARAINAARLTASPLFPLPSPPPAHAQSRTRAAFPDVLLPSLRWEELSQSIGHLATAADRERRAGLMKMTRRIQKAQLASESKVYPLIRDLSFKWWEEAEAKPVEDARLRKNTAIHQGL